MKMRQIPMSHRLKLTYKRSETAITNNKFFIKQIAIDELSEQATLLLPSTFIITISIIYANASTAMLPLEYFQREIKCFEHKHIENAYENRFKQITYTSGLCLRYLSVVTENYFLLQNFSHFCIVKGCFAFIGYLQTISLRK